uniref:Uncharacterized protein LOC114337306 n=1 Tax=Diabrotica virgifera virgifera TaxID=50390 RepID=A0A6P7GI95_DIAVI
MTSKSLIVLSLYLILQSSYGDDATKGVQETFGLTQPIPTLKLYRLGQKSYYLGNIFKKIIEITFILITDTSGEYIFTSFTRIPDGENYVSLTSGKTLTYFNWHEGQPNGGTEECIGLYLEKSEVQWHDVSCWSKYYFICEVVWTNREQELLELLNNTLQQQIGIVDNIRKFLLV